MSFVVFEPSKENTSPITNGLWRISLRTKSSFLPLVTENFDSVFDECVNDKSGQKGFKGLGGIISNISNLNQDKGIVSPFVDKVLAKDYSEFKEQSERNCIGYFLV